MLNMDSPTITKGSNGFPGRKPSLLDIRSLLNRYDLLKSGKPNAKQQQSTGISSVSIKRSPEKFVHLTESNTDQSASHRVKTTTDDSKRGSNLKLVGSFPHFAAKFLGHMQNRPTISQTDRNNNIPAQTYLKTQPPEENEREPSAGHKRELTLPANEVNRDHFSISANSRALRNNQTDKSPAFSPPEEKDRMYLLKSLLSARGNTPGLQEIFKNQSKSVVRNISWSDSNLV